MLLLKRVKQKLTRSNADYGNPDMEAGCSTKPLALAAYEPPAHIPTPTSVHNMTHHPAHLLPLVKVPPAHTRIFDLNGNVLLYFGSVLSIGKTAKKRIGIISDQCIYIGDTKGVVLRCLAIKKIANLYNHSLQIGVHMEDGYDVAIEFPNEEELTKFALVVVTVRSKMDVSPLEVEGVSPKNLFNSLSLEKPLSFIPGKEIFPIPTLKTLFQHYETLSKPRNTVGLVEVPGLPGAKIDVSDPASPAEMTHHPLTLLPLIPVPTQYKNLSYLTNSVVHYISAVNKLSRKGADKERVLVVSDKAVYIMQKDGEVARCITMESIAKLATEGQRLGIVVSDGYDVACEFETSEEVARVVDIFVRICAKMKTVQTPLRVEVTRVQPPQNIASPQGSMQSVSAPSSLDTLHQNYKALYAEGRRMSLEKI